MLTKKWRGVKRLLIIVLIAALAALAAFGGCRAQIEQEPGPVIAVLDPAGQLMQLPLERFLVGVVAAETPASFPLAARQAQAVAARTYILAALESGGRHREAVVCCDPACCQAWRDPQQLTAEEAATAQRAVSSTNGLAVTYAGQLVSTPFCSCCGGRSESAAACWGGTDCPWLQPQDCPWCTAAPRFCAVRVFPAAEAAQKLSCAVEDLAAMQVQDVTPGGRVGHLQVGGQEWSGTEVRAAWELNSAAFNWLLLGDNLLLATLGFGHGVGLCQYGAAGQAAAGADFRQILQYYYSGVEVESAY